jgi:hypothetical protein
MPPKETDHLLPLTSVSSATTTVDVDDESRAIELDNGSDVDESLIPRLNNHSKRNKAFTTIESTRILELLYNATILISLVAVSGIAWQQHRTITGTSTRSAPNNIHSTIDRSHDVGSDAAAIGPYTVIKEVQEGNDFWSYYNFYEGNDTLGSAGYNTYVNMSYAMQHKLIQTAPSEDCPNGCDTRDVIYMKSKPTDGGPRESIRIEGKTRFTSDVGGLFILDLDHIPVGCGQWPAFWLTDTMNWPYNGEIDIVEGVNLQNKVKTALHTSNECSMYAHVPSYKMTGIWDRATGIPDTYTGTMDYNTSLPADNCYAMAPHQWMNQGCVIESSDDNTIGSGINNVGNGGIYVLQWDPTVTHSIQSYVFLKSSTNVPSNLLDSIKYATYINAKSHKRNFDASRNLVPKEVYPDPQSWVNELGNLTVLPYAYFAIGNTTGCGAQHFNNMNLIFNLAFCGNVAGNRFTMDQCGIATNGHNEDPTDHDDPIKRCNDYIMSQPNDLNNAYWAIRGLYVYERSRIV